jgi:methionyl-tRNA formyltransferase
MNVVLLTTPAFLRVHLAKELSEIVPLRHVLLETRSLKTKFETKHEFERMQDEYELERYFGGIVPRMADCFPSDTVDSVNSDESLSILSRLQPDILITFGTGRISPAVIECAKVDVINFHRGDPEHYRGLDCHLWQIYHNEFSPFITTLHRVNHDIDDGGEAGSRTSYVTGRIPGVLYQTPQRRIRKLFRDRAIPIDETTRQGTILFSDACVSQRHLRHEI